MCCLCVVNVGRLPQDRAQVAACCVFVFLCPVCQSQQQCCVYHALVLSALCRQFAALLCARTCVCSSVTGKKPTSSRCTGCSSGESERTQQVEHVTQAHMLRAVRIHYGRKGKETLAARRRAITANGVGSHCRVHDNTLVLQGQSDCHQKCKPPKSTDSRAPPPRHTT